MDFIPKILLVSYSLRHGFFRRFKILSQSLYELSDRLCGRLLVQILSNIIIVFYCVISKFYF